MRRFKLYSLFLAVVFIAGCGQVYSPYLMLPSEPLKQDDVQVVGGISALPALGEVFPGADAGATGLIRFGVTDRFSLEGEMWTNDIIHYNKTGFSLQAVELLSDRKLDWRFGLIPRVCIVNSGYQLESWGASASVALWTPKLFGLSPYIAAGAGVGAADLGGATPQYAFGYSVVENAGLSYELWSHATINFEVAGLGIFDMHNHKYYGWVVPSVAAGYRF